VFALSRPQHHYFKEKNTLKFWEPEGGETEERKRKKAKLKQESRVAVRKPRDAEAVFSV